MQETPNLELPLYELDDMANLDDGYNAAMKKIDEAYQEIADKFPISGEDIENGSINTEDLANGAISENKLATGAVTHTKIASGAVGAEQIAEGAVGAEQIAEGAVGAEQIAEGAVTQSKLAKPILLIFGDSYSDFSETGRTNWVELAQIPQILGCEVKNFAHGGASFTSTTNNITSQINTAMEQLTDDEKSRIKWVVVTAGTNDWSSSTVPTNWLSSIKSVFSLINSNFQCEAFWAPTSRGVTGQNGVMRYYFKNIQSLAVEEIPYMHCSLVKKLPYFWVGKTSADVFSDNLHLNTTGAMIYGNLILNELLGHNVSSGICVLTNVIGQNQGLATIYEDYSLNIKGASSAGVATENKDFKLPILNNALIEFVWITGDLRPSTNIGGIASIANSTVMGWLGLEANSPTLAQLHFGLSSATTGALYFCYS